MKNRISLLLLCTTITISAQQALRNTITRAQRRANALIIRNAASNQEAARAIATQMVNGDIDRYTDKRALFAKGLPFSDTGFVDVNAFNRMQAALRSGNPALLDTIPMGTNPIVKKLVDPQAAYTFNLAGADTWIIPMTPPPALSSAEMAGELVELYWQAYVRDVFFTDYESNPDVANAVADLNQLSDFKGPRENGQVTAKTVFRGATPGNLVGPYISQFLYLPLPYGPKPNYEGQFQTRIVPMPDPNTNDFMTTFDEWLAIERGNNPTRTTTYDLSGPWFITSGRDLAEFVHFDYPTEAFDNAAMILLNFGKAALDPNNPYVNNPTQAGFVSYGGSDVFYLISVATELALRAAWYHKWLVHLRLRPEYAGFLADCQKSGVQDMGLHNDLMNAFVLEQIFTGYHSYLLPQAYPEGSPLHPSYPAGHAAIGGACVTILKAFFNEAFVIPNPVAPDATNDNLIPYTDSQLTVGNELNKLASNICMGRNFAGIHYRSDGEQGMLLGEQVAIALLENEAFSRHNPFNGYSLTKFDGNTITIGARKTVPTL